MLKSPQDVGLRAEMHRTMELARRASRDLPHGGEVEHPAPPPSSAPAVTAGRPTGQAGQALPRAGRQVVLLSPEPDSAAAQVLAALLGSDTDSDTGGLKPALARLTAHNKAALDTEAGTDTLLSALASQLCILEALWQRYTLEAIRSTDINCKAPLQKIAFAAQSAYLRTAVLIASALDARKIVSTTGGNDPQD